MNDTIRDIVVGIGGTEEADPHFDAAVQTAESLGATLHVVHAYRVPEPMFAPYPEIGAYAPEVAEAAVEAAGRRLDELVSRSGGGADVRARIVPGPADVAVTGVADEVGAGLIIVGATERGTVSRTLLGTTAGRVVRTASSPVLVDRRATPGPRRRVLLTTDLSDHSQRVYARALQVVRALGGGDGVEVRALLVVGDDLALDPDRRPAALQAIRERELLPFIGRADAGGLTGSGTVRMGDAATEIRAEAEEWGADLLVLGTHGRGGMTRLLIGSVAEAVVRRPPCDVLVIPNAAVEPRNEES